MKLCNDNLIQSKKTEKRERIDLSKKLLFIQKLNSDDSPMLPLIQIEHGMKILNYGYIQIILQKE